MSRAAASPDLSPRDRAALAGVSVASTVASALPQGLLAAGADAAGELWYRVSPARAAQARRNLGRVAGALADDPRASALVRRAATDPRALERLVRSAFRHLARYYVEVARTGELEAERLAENLAIETPATVDAAVAEPGGFILVGMHIGALELPALYLAQRTDRTMVTPMEVVANPGLQAWFERSRGRVGVRIVTLAEARRALVDGLRSGLPAGLVGDRDITGGGTLVELFGAPARLPLGPALVALETGAPVYVGAARRVGGGRYRARLIRVDTPREGTRRARANGLLSNIARAFEDLVADDPAQWWACFHPVWPDLEAVP